MKLAWLKRKIQTRYLCRGLLALAVCLLLSSANLVQAADTRIAFMSNRIDWKNGEIYLMNADGKRLHQLTKHPQYDEEPTWSPDGQKITFVSFRDLEQIPERGIWRGEIYMMNTDGTNLINLTHSPERPDGVSSWSPDGKQIAFTSAELFNEDILANSDIFMMAADGTNPINLTNHPAIDRGPSWEPAPTLNVSSKGKLATLWGKVKRTGTYGVR